MTKEERRKLLPLATRAALASVAMASFLLLLKGVAAWATGSVAMLGSLADTGLDLLASLVTLYGVRLAAQPADHDHRFGHGKAEALAALFQVALITASAVGIAWRAILSLGSQAATTDADFGIGVSIAAIAATGVLLWYQRRVIRSTGSVAIMADNVHYQSDMLLNGSVILALVLDQYFGFHNADPVFGIIIAAWLAWGAFQASSNAIDQLMDKEWPEDLRARFLDVAARQHGLKGIHDFRTRRSGSHDFAQFHMEVDRRLSVHDAHEIVEAVEGNLKKAFPKVEVLIHLDPEGHVDTDNPLVEADVTPHWFGKRVVMRIPFAQIDAFADTAFAGNPAAVMPLSAWLDDDVLLRIAAENNLSETAFLVACDDGDADFELRWFTPAAEVALCGHATLASGHVVLSSHDALDRVRFRTRQAGLLEVARDGAGYRMALPAWAPSPKPLPSIVAALGVEAIETLWHDKGYAVAVLAEADAVRRAAPDMRALKAEGPIVAIVTGPGDTSDIVSRVFVPAFDIDEDPVTGSAHAVVVPYWAGRLGRDRFTAVQASARGGRLDCALAGDRVVLGGACVTVIEGTFVLP